MISTSLLLLLAAVHCVHSVELTQPASSVVTPGQSLTLTCKLSGYSVTASYCTHWIRQPAGKTLEWIGEICGDGNTYYSEKLKSRFQVSRDTSSSTVTLTGQNMQTEDTAVYYCAREPTVRQINNIPVQKPPVQKPQCSVHSVELTQPASSVVTPGQSLTLTCKVSGYSLTDGSYRTAWIRQTAGKTLEWIGEILYNGNTFYSEKLKSRFQVSRDTSSSTVTLTGQNMQTEDTAVYYCARKYHMDKALTHEQCQFKP
ncbi:immunoglobulin alpha-2 heavy chain-like [Clarias gariepinus]|uniref:immunoglobulin alpha-2 heavy chain-like n=1 Tax=Clarias gariepinus TaxID=13013 RepID=UPI00234C4E06|nr:immunoglobulin alpha-2 heavy chain-like [Clarias gariepinus]